ncbi:uncharacterized protein A1O5_13371 [Cladophialophora psammophila CBS 110553]|uniref:Major facilitator superfamily (MFS) profile domain-containing protein n=1 Tax=Cladophialophora psammophila CBS 110553 TaxID=1182543 RepID=W9VCR7_9EURO|nr:uncharacterized protein A1O5_13371 [Cladophialophora psammophila CBS 110553]EXJ53382.1 hypothetical protein A1O5_13371 [Cladophialophora psammophila CBS 110553]
MNSQSSVHESGEGIRATKVDMCCHVEEAAANDGEKLQQVFTQNSVTITRSSWWDNRKVLAVSCFVNFAAFEYGLDQGTVNGFQAMPGFLMVFGYRNPALPGGLGITTTVQQLITSLVALGMLVSSLACGPLMHRTGRRAGISIGCAFAIISATVQIVTTTVSGLYVGRLLLGLGNGLLLTGAFLYMNEIMPANLRSLNYTIYIFWVNLGNLIGSIINNATSVRLDRASYQIPLGTLYIMAVILPLGLFFLPESPRLLALKDRKAEATKALRFFRGSKWTDLQIEEEIAEIVHAIEVDRELSQSASFAALFYRPNRKRSLISIGVYLYLAACGSQFIVQYGIYFFVLSGDTHPFRDGVILVCIGLFGGLVTPLYTGRVGKRVILTVAPIIGGFCMLGMGIAYTTHGLDKVGANTILAMSFLYMFIFAGALAPFASQVAAELPSQALRGHTLGLASALTYLGGWLLTFTVPYFINPTALNWGANYGYLWVPFNFLIAAFTYFCVPETNKRTLEEIDECFVQGVPVRKFSSYEAVASRQAREDVIKSYRKTAQQD